MLRNVTITVVQISKMCLYEWAAIFAAVLFGMKPLT